jgi:hypothetical protein
MVGGEAQDNKRAVWPDGCTVSTSAALLATHNIAEGAMSRSAMTADTKRSRRQAKLQRLWTRLGMVSTPAQLMVSVTRSRGAW